MEEIIKKETKKLLNEVGISPHLRGYKYIIEAVQMLYKDEKIAMGVICYTLAIKDDTTRSTIERCIKYAIKEAYSYIADYFKAKHNITSKAFLHMLLEEIKERIEE